MPGEKVTVEVPEGMTPEKLLKLLSKYETEKIAGKAREKARRKAVRALIDAHEDEYEGFLEMFKKS